MGKGSRRNQGNQGNTRNQRRDQIERKRDERSQRNALKKEKQGNTYGNEDDDSKGFRNQLQLQGFKMRDVIGDGNCLFRAFADQMDGNESMHFNHRKETVLYMEEHEDEFVPFLEETVNFKRYLKDLASRGTYGGNDSIVAFARSNSVDVVIHQLNNPTFIIEGNNTSGQKTVVHLAYHDYEHYSSVRRSNDPCTGPAHNFHKETDSVATGKCIEKTEDCSTVTEQGHEDNEVSRKVKRKNKKKHTQIKVEGDECEISQDFISEAVEEIKTKCGCEDTEYIRNVFVDNSCDIDSTLSFIFQTMDLTDENKSDAAQSLTIMDAAVDFDDTAVNHIHDANKEPSCEAEIEEKNDLIEINEEENECEANSDFISEAVEEIRTKCGCEDTEYIRNIFVDNSYDVDSTLTFILQTMHLTDDNKSDAVQSADNVDDFEESTVNHVCDTSEEKSVEVEIKEQNDKVSSCSCSCAESKPGTSKCSCEGVEEEKGSNFNGAKKKNTPAANKSVPVKHMSNRQRKELAKQARKKRRQESRKSESNTDKSAPTEQASKNIISINI